MGLFDNLFRKAAMGAGDDAKRLSPAEEDLRAQLEAIASDDETASSPLRYRLHWTGTVQGVGFRWTNQGLARERKLTGWVRNNDDGSVDMEIQGAPGRLYTHLKALHANYVRMATRIWLDEAVALPLIDDGDTFDVRY